MILEVLFHCFQDCVLFTLLGIKLLNFLLNSEKLFIYLELKSFIFWFKFREGFNSLVLGKVLFLLLRLSYKVVDSHYYQSYKNPYNNSKI